MEHEKGSTEVVKYLQELEKSLEKREKKLQEREKSLEEREEDLQKQKEYLQEWDGNLQWLGLEIDEDLQKQKEDLQEWEEGLQQLEKSLEEIEEGLIAREEDLQQLEKSLEEIDEDLIAREEKYISNFTKLKSEEITEEIKRLMGNLEKKNEGLQECFKKSEQRDTELKRKYKEKALRIEEGIIKGNEELTLKNEELTLENEKLKNLMATKEHEIKMEHEGKTFEKSLRNIVNKEARKIQELKDKNKILKNKITKLEQFPCKPIGNFVVAENNNPYHHLEKKNNIRELNKRIHSLERKQKNAKPNH